MRRYLAGSGLEMGNKKLPGMKPNAPIKVHQDWVTKMMYLANSGSLISSSMDSTLKMVRTIESETSMDGWIR